MFFVFVFYGICWLIVGVYFGVEVVLIVLLFFFLCYFFGDGGKESVVILNREIVIDKWI